MKMSSDDDATSPAAAGPPTGGQHAADEPGYRRSSLWRWRGTASLMGALLFAALGWLLVAGAIAQSDEGVLEGARPEELVQILDSLDSQNNDLELEQRRLTGEIESLTSGSQAEALQQARAREQSLLVLAGTTPVRGPGMRMVVRDPGDGVRAADVLDAVQELRDAGAEAIQIGDSRVVAETWFADPAEEADGGIVIDGRFQDSPYPVLAIGDPDTLTTAMEIPGGVAATFRTAGAQVDIEPREALIIEATVPPATPQYAEPVAPD